VQASAGYGGTVTLRREGGRTIFTRATTAAGNPKGLGLRIGDRIAVAYAPNMEAGIVSYSIAPGGKLLRGTWLSNVSPHPGTENLTRP